MTSRIVLDPPVLWPHQQEFVDHPSRYTVCKSATKCGKTMAAAWWLAREAVRNPGALFWWVGPTNEVGLIGYKTVLHFMESAGVVEKRGERPWKFRMMNGTMVCLKTAQEPDYLRGAGVKGMVLDEAGSPDFDDAWSEIHTTIQATRGRLKIIGNPGEAGSFFDNAEMWGEDPEMPEWSFRRWKFMDRPTATEKDLRDAMKELGGEDSPDFRRYYLGETIRGEGVFFYGLEQVATAEMQEPQPGREYVIGVDPAIKSDYFVASVFDLQDWRQVAVSRHKGPPSEQQEDETERLAREYNDAAVVIEVNGPGGPIHQRLVARGCRMWPFNTSGKSKPEILYGYRSAISRGQVKLLNDPYQLREHYQFQRKQSGVTGSKFSAPSGGHDDMVMANAIAVHGLQQYIVPEYMDLAL